MFQHSGGFNLVEDLWELNKKKTRGLSDRNAGPAARRSTSFKRRQSPLRDFLIHEILAGHRKEVFASEPGRANRACPAFYGRLLAPASRVPSPETFFFPSAHSAALIDNSFILGGACAHIRTAGGLAELFGNPPNPRSGIASSDRPAAPFASSGV